MRAEEMLQRAPPLLKAMGKIPENGTRNSRMQDDRYFIHATEALIVALLISLLPLTH